MSIATKYCMPSNPKNKEMSNKSYLYPAATHFHCFNHHRPSPGSILLSNLGTQVFLVACVVGRVCLKKLTTQLLIRPLRIAWFSSSPCLFFLGFFCAGRTNFWLSLLNLVYARVNWFHLHVSGTLFPSKLKMHASSVYFRYFPYQVCSGNHFAPTSASLLKLVKVLWTLRTRQYQCDMLSSFLHNLHQFEPAKRWFSRDGMIA